MRRSNRKRFNKPTTTQPQESGNFNKTSSFGILPAPGILESYEEISPGSVKNIIAMVKSEQEHRHRWENSYLKSISNSHRINQLLIFILAIVIIYASISFTVSHEKLMAIFIVIFGFGFLAVLALANKLNKKDATRPTHQQYAHRKKRDRF